MNSMFIKHERVQMIPEGESLTKEAFAKECDINQIMRQYQKNGLLNHLNTHQGNYGDFLNFEDYHSSLNKILAAKDAFNTIPAQIRAKFDNDPSAFMTFAQDKENYEELVKMGLAEPRKAQEGGKEPEEYPRRPLPIKEPEEAPKGDDEPKKPLEKPVAQ